MNDQESIKESIKELNSSVEELESAIKELIRIFIATNLEKHGEPVTYEQEVCNHKIVALCYDKYIYDVHDLFTEHNKSPLTINTIIFLKNPDGFQDQKYRYSLSWANDNIRYATETHTTTGCQKVITLKLINSRGEYSAYYRIIDIQ